MTKDFTLQQKDPYLSIRSLQSTKLPELSVICGPNGSGKTHLLTGIGSGKILAYSSENRVLRAKTFNGAPTIQTHPLTFNDLKNKRQAAEDTYKLIETLEKLLQKDNNSTNVYFNNRWHKVDRQTILQVLINYYKDNSSPQFSGNMDLEFGRAFVEWHEGMEKSYLSSFKLYVPLKILEDMNSFYGTDIKEHISNFFEYQTFMNIDVSSVFYRYFEEDRENQIRLHDKTECLTQEEFLRKFGSPPWEEVNGLLSKYGFKHRFIPPNSKEDPRAIKGFTALIICEDGAIIQAEDLSSGEKVIISLLLSAYAAQQYENQIFQVETPDLILFDELDAHLHPSMIRMMFDVIQTYIVGKLECPVILTTHSASTVALAPDDCIFKLTSGGQHKLTSIEKATASRELTDGFFQLFDDSQIIIVEGKDDPPFYRAIERALRSIKELTNVPPLHFVPASHTEDSSHGGGAHAASDWALKLQATKLPNIHALLDRDENRLEKGVIKVLEGRYAIENYILDPLSLSIALITDQKLSDVDTEAGKVFTQVSSLSQADPAELQDLVNSICKFIDSDSLTSDTVMVNYVCGISLSIPKWILSERGKDLVKKVREAFKKIHSSYIITQKDSYPYDIELGYLLKLWTQYPEFFPKDLVKTLMKFS